MQKLFLLQKSLRESNELYLDYQFAVRLIYAKYVVLGLFFRILLKQASKYQFEHKNRIDAS